MNPFDEKAATWDDNPGRRELARHIFAAMGNLIEWNPAWLVLDAGAGTGLLTLAVALQVRHVTAVDTSAKMLEVLASKAAALPVTPHPCSLEDLDLPAGSFDAVVSSMALHHVGDTAAALAGFARVLQPGGHLLLADLDAEDGSFHADNTGVAHFGFDRAALSEKLTYAGFTAVRFSTAWEMERPLAQGGIRAFPIFCLHAVRQ